MKECVIQEQKMNIFQKKPFLFCAFEPISKKGPQSYKYMPTVSSKQSFLEAKFG